MTFDILIRNGIVFDGSGSAGSAQDLAIAGRSHRGHRHGRCRARRKTIIDAAGLAVAPGFIDIKTHSDFTLPINPKAESKVRQGVTTEIIGHCGFSVAPCLPGKVELLRDYLSPSAPWLPFRELTLPGLSRHLPGDRRQCRHAGRPQHAAADGDGDEPRPADAGRDAAHDRTAGRRPRRRRARPVVGPVHRARLVRAAGRDDRARSRGEALQRRLLHPSARRIEQGAGVGRRSDRGRRDLRRPCRDRALQVLGHRQLGQDRAGARDDRGGPRPRRRCRLRRLSVHRRQQPAEEPAAAMGAGRRRRRHDRAPGASPRPARASATTSPATASTTGAASESWEAVQISISPHLPQFAGQTIAAARRRARPGPDRHALRLSDRGPGRDARAGHLDLGGRRARSGALADRAGRLRRQLRRDLRHRQPGHAAPALLRHLPAHRRPLRATN